MALRILLHRLALGIPEGCLAGCEASCNYTVQSNTTVRARLGCDG